MKPKKGFDLARAMQGKRGREEPHRAGLVSRTLGGVPILWMIPIVVLCLAALFFVYMSFFT